MPPTTYSIIKNDPSTSLFTPFLDALMEYMLSLGAVPTLRWWCYIPAPYDLYVGLNLVTPNLLFVEFNSDTLNGTINYTLGTPYPKSRFEAFFNKFTTKK